MYYYYYYYLPESSNRTPSFITFKQTKKKNTARFIELEIEIKCRYISEYKRICNINLAVHASYVKIIYLYFGELCAYFVRQCVSKHSSEEKCTDVDDVVDGASYVIKCVEMYIIIIYIDDLSCRELGI